jgi:hypothetical protein
MTFDGIWSALRQRTAAAGDVAERITNHIPHHVTFIEEKRKTRRGVVNWDAFSGFTEFKRK